ncbi:uncharacterized protein LOC142160642 [Mixophyes fleayi]|uniref:uncharacterized protein LOC142160642 n=1 Tax=Mixophyes fleayi TaxID=3061075 RepID=UPI003F4E0D8F
MTSKFYLPQCVKSFRHKSSLVRHPRIYTGVKLFPCSECGKGFTAKCHLIEHQRLHMDEKTFYYSECGKCSTHKSSLVTHQGIYTAKIQFSCSECSKTFTKRPALFKHQRIDTTKNKLLLSGQMKFYDAICTIAHISTGPLSRTQSPITVPPPHSEIHERNNDQKILELTNKIIQLLTGEGPIRCEDVTVYFCMQDWEYLAGQTDLDVMMENHWPLSSLDASSNRNTPERCARPLYSQDCTEENHSIPQEYQAEDVTDIKVEDTDGEEETYVMGDQQCKEEEIPTDISIDGSSHRNPPERCFHPLYSQDCAEENHSTPQEYEGGDLTDIKVEVIDGDEVTYIIGDPQCKEEEIPTDISTEMSSSSSSGEESVFSPQEMSPEYQPRIKRTKSAATSTDKRKRSHRFSLAENVALVNGVLRNYHQLFGRPSSLSFGIEPKEDIWRRIAEEVSSVGRCRRNATVCRKRFSDCKISVKKKLSIIQQHAQGTGGGPPMNIELVEWELKLRDHLTPDAVIGVSSGLDTGVETTLCRFAREDNTQPTDRIEAPSTSEMSSSSSSREEGILSPQEMSPEYQPKTKRTAPAERSSSAISEDQRKRSHRFSLTENEALVDGVLRNYNQLFGRPTGHTLGTEAKEAIWREIAEEVTSVGRCRRNATVCRKRFSDCKISVKKKLSVMRQQAKKTGGGPPMNIELVSWERRLQYCLAPEPVIGVSSGLDTGTESTVCRFVKEENTHSTEGIKAPSTSSKDVILKRKDPHRPQPSASSGKESGTSRNEPHWPQPKKSTGKDVSSTLKDPHHHQPTKPPGKDVSVKKHPHRPQTTASSGKDVRPTIKAPHVTLSSKSFVKDVEPSRTDLEQAQLNKPSGTSVSGGKRKRKDRHCLTGTSERTMERTDQNADLSSRTEESPRRGDELSRSETMATEQGQQSLQRTALKTESAFNRTVTFDLTQNGTIENMLPQVYDSMKDESSISMSKTPEVREFTQDWEADDKVLTAREDASDHHSENSEDHSTIEQNISQQCSVALLGGDESSSTSLSSETSMIEQVNERRNVDHSNTTPTLEDLDNVFHGTLQSFRKLVKKEVGGIRKELRYFRRTVEDVSKFQEQHNKSIATSFRQIAETFKEIAQTQKEMLLAQQEMIHVLHTKEQDEVLLSPTIESNIEHSSVATESICTLASPTKSPERPPRSKRRIHLPQRFVEN